MENQNIDLKYLRNHHRQNMERDREYANIVNTLHKKCPIITRKKLLDENKDALIACYRYQKQYGNPSDMNALMVLVDDYIMLRELFDRAFTVKDYFKLNELSPSGSLDVILYSGNKKLSPKKVEFIYDYVRQNRIPRIGQRTEQKNVKENEIKKVKNSEIEKWLLYNLPYIGRFLFWIIKSRDLIRA